MPIEAIANSLATPEYPSRNKSIEAHLPNPSTPESVLANRSRKTRWVSNAYVTAAPGMINLS
jgi:hypothetical protein